MRLVWLLHGQPCRKPTAVSVVFTSSKNPPFENYGLASPAALADLQHKR
jgi:hypothetical protein